MTATSLPEPVPDSARACPGSTPDAGTSSPDTGIDLRGHASGRPWTRTGPVRPREEEPTPRIPRPADTTTAPRPYRWTDDAACRDLDGDAFFRTGEDAKDAKAACLECPVLTPCWAHALALPERYGVWGGLDEDERARLLRDARRARKEQGAPSGPAAQAGAA